MTLNLDFINFTLISIVAFGSIVIGFIGFYITMTITVKNNISPDSKREISEIKKKLNVLENQHYMLNLDIEKSRQKLGKSTDFLESLKSKTYNVDMDKIRKELENQ